MSAVKAVGDDVVRVQVVEQDAVDVGRRVTTARNLEIAADPALVELRAVDDFELHLDADLRQGGRDESRKLGWVAEVHVLHGYVGEAGGAEQVLRLLQVE